MHQKYRRTRRSRPRQRLAVDVVKPSRTLSIEEFCDYIERCRVWLAKYVGYVTPEPDPDWAPDAAKSVQQVTEMGHIIDGRLPRG